jgi:hypothetical protein
LTTLCPGNLAHVTTLLLAHLLLGLVALLVMGFVALLYRGRQIPRVERLTEKVEAVAERVDPGQAPPLGVLSTPEKSRAMSARFERAEHQVRRLVTAGRG